MKKYKKIILIPIIFLVALLFLIIFIAASNQKVHYNAEYVIGNTSGNLMNGGLFCEVDDKIYFSNQKDDGALYVMNLDCTDFRKINTDYSTSINVAGKYIYYVRQNNKKETNSDVFGSFNNSGLYRINLDGTNTVTLNNDPTGISNIIGNYIYYQHYNSDEGLTLYRIKIDKKDNIKIMDEAVSPATIVDNTLYYTSSIDNHNIKALDLDTLQTSSILEGNYYNPIVIKNYIYYMIPEENYKIGRCNLDGTNPTILVEDRTCTFNITQSGKYLYYQVDGGNNNRLCMMNLQTKEVTDIITGNFNYINITSNYVFFKDILTKTSYVLTVGENGQLGKFNPPVIKSK